MNYFTYKNYIECIHTFRLNAVLQLAEDSVKYRTRKDKIEYTYEKILGKILKQKEEVVNIINEYIKPKDKITKENLDKYEIVSKKFKLKSSEIIYKLKNKEMFFLIEHQSKIDTNMPYKILNSCVDIIQEWKKEKEMTKIKEYPLIVPIVIYTGKEKWNIQENIKEKQMKYVNVEKYRIDLKYNLIDINKISISKLEKDKSIFSNMIMYKKSENKEKAINKLEKVITQEEKEELLKII